MSPDPLEYVDSSNLYAYCNNNPWGRFDPDGLETLRAYDWVKAADKGDASLKAWARERRAVWAQDKKDLPAAIETGLFAGATFSLGGPSVKVGEKALASAEAKSAWNFVKRTAGNLWEDAAALAKLGKEQAIKSIAGKTSGELLLGAAKPAVTGIGVANAVDGYRTGDMSAEQGSAMDVVNSFNAGIVQSAGMLMGNPILESGADIANSAYVKGTRGLGIAIKEAKDFVRESVSPKVEQKEKVEKEDKD